MLSFATPATSHQPASAAAETTAHMTSTDKVPVVSAQSTGHATKDNKNKQPGQDAAKPSAASKAASAASPLQSGQGNMAFSTPAQGSGALSLGVAVPPDNARVNAGLCASQIPAGIMACAAIEDSSAGVCSMLLVAGCHLVQWLSTVKLVSNDIRHSYGQLIFSEPVSCVLLSFVSCLGHAQAIDIYMYVLCF